VNAHESAHVDESLDELRRSLAGAVLVPDGDAARRGFNALIDRRPARRRAQPRRALRL
jgi:hypothetical protein